MKKFLSLVLALAMTFALVTVSASAKTSFTDKDTITYSEAVDVLTGIKVIDGYTDGSFQPTANVTRGAAAKIICNMVLGPTTAAALSADTKPFSDVATSNVFAGYIAYCSQQGIINGYADGTFKPANNVTGYQFLKMLLGALDYDSETEGFTGANWSINVAKLALALSLTSGNDEFNGAKAATREEACLYAFNTLKATMVEYANKGTTITVGNTNVNIGASKATEMKNTAFDYRSGTTNAELAVGTMQFCEQYFKNLKLDESANTDAFGRPANTWTYKSTKIGTYAKTATKTYTAQVKLGDIYSDLGLSKTTTTKDYFVDGLDTADLVLAKGSATKIGGNGVVVEAFKTDEGVVTLVVINTYVGKVASVTGATASADRYVTLSELTHASGSNLTTYETESFAAKDLVSYTTAWNTTNLRYEIQSVKALDKTASGTMTAYTGTNAADATSNFTAGGTTYKYSANRYVQDAADQSKGVTSFSFNSSLDVYCDAYGYALYVVATESTKNYAVVVAIGTTNAYGNGTNGCTLLLADGTTVTATYKMADNNALGGYQNTPGSSNSYVNFVGDLVTYSVGSDGIYTLKTADPYVSGKASWTSKYYSSSSNDIGTPATKAAATTVDFKNGKSLMTIGGNTLYTTANTLFFVRTAGAEASLSNKWSYKVYTGYAAAPTMDAAYGVTYVTNSSYPTQVDAVFVAAGTVKGISANATYLLRTPSVSIVSQDGVTSYAEIPAVVNGEVTTQKVSADLLTGAMTVAKGYICDTVTKDSNDVITGATPVNTEPQTNTPTYSYLTANGTIAANGVVVGFGTSKTAALYWAYNDSTVVYYVNDEGKVITKSDVSSIITDANDAVTYKIDTNTKVVTAIYVTSENANTFDNYAASSMGVFMGTSAEATTALAATSQTLLGNGGDVIAFKFTSIKDQAYTLLVMNGTTKVMEETSGNLAAGTAKAFFYNVAPTYAQGTSGTLTTTALTTGTYTYTVTGADGTIVANGTFNYAGF